MLEFKKGKIDTLPVKIGLENRKLKTQNPVEMVLRMRN